MHQPGYTTFGAESYLSWECHRRAREVPNDVPGGPDDIGTTRFGLSVRENPLSPAIDRPPLLTDALGLQVVLYEGYIPPFYWGEGD